MDQTYYVIRFCEICIYIPIEEQENGQEERYVKRGFQKGYTPVYKQDTLRVYKHTGKDKHSEFYKDALNAAANEVRTSK